ncbi:Centromere protein M [Frankliniella fusca]|uniref:Centromere protein M n=1 Tax=Frankliniella fusca TaxID=407009 RepID=A0AAE1LTX8_9NEOP|nr:Centromere protein M [Frankliniella fusca]
MLSYNVKLEKVTSIQLPTQLFVMLALHVNRTEEWTNGRNGAMAGFVPFCLSSDSPLSLLLVADNGTHLQSLLKGLQQVKDQNNDTFNLHSCESVKQLLKLTEPPPVDFVAFCVNLKRLNALNEIEGSILRLDQAFLLNRICLVCDRSQASSALMPKIINMKHKYQLHVIWGYLESKPEEVSMRLLNLASAVCGANSGFPLITHREWHERQRQDGDFSSIASDGTS